MSKSYCGVNIGFERRGKPREGPIEDERVEITPFPFTSFFAFSSRLHTGVNGMNARDSAACEFKQVPSSNRNR